MKPNKIIYIDNNTIGLVLEPSDKICLIDSKNYNLVKNYRWCLKSYKGKNITQFYVIADIYPSNKKIKISRLILNFPNQLDVDHINNDGLDNRESNLRITTRSQNFANRHNTVGRSKYKGVSWHKHNKRWRSYIKLNYKHIHIGYFKNETDAALAYNKKAIELFGEYAHLNTTTN